MHYSDIDTALRAALPPELREFAPTLARLVADVRNGALAPEAARRQISADPVLRILTGNLAGQELSAGQSQVVFGQGSQTGDVSIRDIAGRDVINVALNLTTIQQRTPSSLSASERRNRAKVLNAVQAHWITGYLDRSLHATRLIELELEQRPEAVQYPWELVVQRPSQADLRLPAGTTMIHVFDAQRGQLLLLGEPGAGKTIMLLDLARSLLRRAEEDESEPIPVVLNLSTWGVRRQPIIEWISVELYERYGVSRSVAEAWIQDDALTLLLDGLDEVEPVHRLACVAKLNDFCRGRLINIVVCSRTEDYSLLKTQLRLQSAVVVQPLTEAQVMAYLDAGGPALQLVQSLVQADPGLRELARSPLMLSVIALTYAGTRPEALPPAASVAARREQLLESYVEQMFQRRSGRAPFAKDATLAWLAQIAALMRRQSLSTFYIEGLQPHFALDLPRQQLFRRTLRVITGLILGITIGAVFGGVVGFVWGAWAGVLAWMAVGLLAGIGLDPDKDPLTIEPVEKLHWSLDAARAAMRQQTRLTTEQLSRYPSVYAFAPLNGVIAGLLGGFVGAAVERRSRPNQAIWRSLRSGFRAAALIALVGAPAVAPVIALLLWMFATLPRDLNQNVSFWIGTGAGATLLFALIFGLLGWLRLGGLSFIQHFLLRLLLALDGRLPWKLPRLLHYGAERALLRQVGAGYVFVHRLVLEHIADRLPAAQLHARQLAVRARRPFFVGATLLGLLLVLGLGSIIGIGVSSFLSERALAAATARRAFELVETHMALGRIYYSGSGVLEHKGLTLVNTSENLPNRVVRDFIVEVSFVNPYTRLTGKWDYGIFFRDTDREDDYRLYIDSDQQWHFSVVQGEVNNAQETVATSAHINRLPGQENTLRLLVLGERGYLFINGAFVAELDTSQRMEAGIISIGTGFMEGYTVAGETTEYRNLVLRSLDPLSSAELRQTALAATATTMQVAGTPTTTTRSPHPLLVQARARGRKITLEPDGVLEHKPDDGNVQREWLGQFEHRDFLVEVEVENPYAASEQRWSMGFYFWETKEQQFRLVIDSYKHWDLYLENDVDVSPPLLSGYVPHLRIGAGESNYLQLLVDGNDGYLFVNDVLTATMDLSGHAGGKGDVFLAQGIRVGEEREGATTPYRNLTFWRLD